MVDLKGPAEGLECVCREQVVWPLRRVWYVNLGSFHSEAPGLRCNG